MQKNRNFNFINKLILLLLLLWGGSSCTTPTPENKTEAKLTSYVNTFVGTDGPGNTYPGAVVPFGMVQLSPDNGLSGWDRIAGYFWQDSTIAGFSHTHLSGTGAGDLYDILFFPTNDRFTEDLWPDNDAYRPYSKFSHKNEEASPGYYKVLLESSGITAELTTTKRVGFHCYTFPENKNSKIIVDLGYALNWDSPVETEITIENDSTISGVRKSTGWAKTQEVYFVARFSKPFDSAELFSGNTKVDSKTFKSKNVKFEAKYATAENEKILVKVSLSGISVEGARKNMATELPGWDFTQTRKKADLEWENYLEKIKVDGTEEQKRTFYSNLYRVFVTPSLFSDADGKFKGANHPVGEAKGFDRYDTYSLWDTYRAAHPLYTILCPDKVKDFIQSFLVHSDENGLLPVWSMAGVETNMMIAYHSVPVIVDAFFKGIPMDTLKAYEACKKSGMAEKEEMKLYRKYGYVPYYEKGKGNWSVSKTLEYAYDDWCIAKFADALGKEEDAEYFYKRGNNWRNLFDNKTGFFRAKDKKGKFFEPFNPDEYSEFYCESNAWQYLWAVQQDIPGFIEAEGKERFVSLLDSMFSHQAGAGIKLPIFSTGMIGQYAHGNEPSHHVPWLYNFVDEPEKTQELTRKIIYTQYSDKPDGYCGNEDCGQMSAWYIFASLGLYPVNPADQIYQLSSPIFQNAEINLPNGKVFKIVTLNNGMENKYIQSIKWNGKPYTNMYISHMQIMNGGTLEFTMGAKPKIEN